MFKVSFHLNETADKCRHRLSTYRNTATYDPFAAPRPQQRYSPPRFDSFGSLADMYGSTRPLPSYEATPPRHSGYPPSATFPVAGKHPFMPRELTQETSMTEYGSSIRRMSQGSSTRRTNSPSSQGYEDYETESHPQNDETGRNPARHQTRRRPFNQDEFDGPSQYLPLPLPHQDSNRAQDLPDLPIHLDINEQDQVIRRTNDVLSECAFHFVAKYQFPVPLERDKPRVRSAADREWTEWAYLLKRLATKRRIPARVLYDNQIKQLVTTLENSIAARQGGARDQTNTRRKPRDDRHILQLVSAGTQVAKILMDSLAMNQLNELYNTTETIINRRRRQI